MVNGNDVNAWICVQLVLMFRREHYVRSACIDDVNRHKKGIRRLFHSEPEKREMFYLKFIDDCIQKIYLINDNDGNPATFIPYKVPRFILNRLDALIHAEFNEVEESIANEQIWRDGSTEREDYRMHSENIIRYQMYSTVLKEILGGLNDEKLVRS